ncbi:MAG: hypothetical protein SFZ03_08555 [Candidatus Melainabacteria bacterium]|nr:hypothetical protein [Candidatus Melainabacteria bacterium]
MNSTSVSLPTAADYSGRTGRVHNTQPFVQSRVQSGDQSGAQFAAQHQRDTYVSNAPVRFGDFDSLEEQVDGKIAQAIQAADNHPLGRKVLAVLGIDPDKWNGGPPGGGGGGKRQEIPIEVRADDGYPPRR